MSIGRRSPAPAPDAWRPWTPRRICATRGQRAGGHAQRSVVAENTMAKLSDLKTLLAGAPRAKRAATPDDAGPASGTIDSAVRAAKTAAADLDLAHAFADVAPLASGNRARHAKVPASTSPAKRLPATADALAASRHGLDASPGVWDVGQEIEPEQTFRRAGLGADIVSKLRRGHWAVQAELDLHWDTRDKAHAGVVVVLAEA